MTRPCLPARDATAAPKRRAPPGGADCHFHIIGPHPRYPMIDNRAYTPPEALVPHYQKMARTLGIERMVVVQPSIYGSDNRCTLDAVEPLGRRNTRAIVVIDDSISDAALKDMAAQGAVGIRINTVLAGGTPVRQVASLAKRLAPLGWHIQVWSHGEQIIDVAPLLHALPVPVVLDHMGGVQSDRGLDSPEFEAVMRLLDTGNVYVKVSGYRSSSKGYPYADVAPIARKLIAAAPERCVWGTDWPHPSLFGSTHMPDDGMLLDLLRQWEPSDALSQQILVDNPARLYGFD
jgi:predicted TIM-barrel fold metal-dependent hydrolase